MAEKKESGPKVGAGHVEAMFRLGLREIRGSLYPESNVAQPTELGVYGTRTPSEIADIRNAETRDLDKGNDSVLEERMRQTESREDRGKDDHERER